MAPSNDSWSQSEWEAHIKKIVIEKMKYSLGALEHEDIPEHIFDFCIRNLENGMQFLRSEHREKVKK
jgi:hypothetical protein